MRLLVFNVRARARRSFLLNVNNRYKTFCIIFVNYLFNQNILFSIVPHN